MNRGEILGAIGPGATSLATLSAMKTYGHEGDHAHEHGKGHQDCLKNCTECAKSCDHAFHHALLQLGEGKKILARTVQLLADCAKFCGLAACTISDHSPVMDHACEACAEVCKETAEACEACDIEEVKVAVRSLRACEQSCRAMVPGSRGDHHAGSAETKPSGSTRP